MKQLFKWAFAMMLVVPSICFVACSDDDPEVIPPTDDPETPVNPTPPTDETAMTSAEQKERLEAVALEVADLIPASDFTQIESLGRYMNDTYIEDYDWDNVEDWADDIFEALKGSVVSTTTEREDWGWTYIYRNYKAIVAASNFTGHFTAQNGKWKQSSANDLQFIFTDRAGANCVLKLETSGSTKNVYVGDIEDWVDDYYDDSKNEWTDYYDRTQLTISVPEHIVVTLTQGGSTVVKATVDIDLKNITNNEFNFATNSMTVSGKVELNNGYVFHASQVAYTANSKASVSCSISKNGTSLVSMSVAADVSDIPNCNLSAFTYDPEDFDWDDANGKNALLKVDVLGKVQIQGTLTDVRSFANNLEDAEDNEENENKFKQYIDKANSLADVNVFYDNSSTKQATFTLEPFEESDYYYRYWSVEPTIHFYDGSSYSFDVFFNEKDFKKVINTYKRLGENYEDLIE